jgi:hypothetical protein
MTPLAGHIRRRSPVRSASVALLLAGLGGAGADVLVGQDTSRQSVLPLGLADAGSGLSSGRGGSSAFQSAGATIHINAGSGLLSNPTALAAFNRAANDWEQYLADPVTINIDANLAPLGTGILGQTGSPEFSAGFNVIRNQMVADNAGGPLSALTGSLPTATGYSPVLPATGSWTFQPTLYATAANLAALGFDLSTVLGSAAHASITFSSTYAFDYDRSDGIGSGLFDFEGVAIHEIGHALGFISEMDYVDGIQAGGTGAHVAWSTPWDLFRFQQTGANPSDLSQFNTFQRNLTPGVNTVCDTIASLYGSTAEMRTSTGANTGDGRQASHWLDQSISGSYPGVMLPALAPGQQVDIGINDLVVLDAIGWNVNYGILAVPEASTWSAGTVLGALVLWQWRRRRA